MSHLMQRTVGPLSVRAWGLVAMFFANLLMVYGLSLVVRTGSGWISLIAGAALSIAAIALLARPS